MTKTTSHMPILNTKKIQHPVTIYLNDNPADSSYYIYEGDYLKFNCEQDNCIIKLQWGHHINTNYYNEISDIIEIDPELDEEIISAVINMRKVFKKYL